VTKLDSSAWSTREFLGLFIGVGMSYGGGPPRRVLGDLEIAAVEELIGVDNVLAKLPPGDATNGAARDQDWDDAESDTSFERRIRLAEATIRRHASRRGEQATDPEEDGKAGGDGPDPQSPRTDQ
jgi:hypothetical protein